MMHAALAGAEARLAVRRPVGRRRGERATWRDLVAAVTGFRPEGRHRAASC